MSLLKIFQSHFSIHPNEVEARFGMAESVVSGKGFAWARAGKPRRWVNGILRTFASKNPLSPLRREGKIQETPDVNQKWRFA